MEIRRRLRLAAYLAHVRRADGSWSTDWAFAHLALKESGWVLQQHLTNAKLPHLLTVAAYAASEDLRANAPASREWVVTEWLDLQARVIRVVPVVQRMLRTLDRAEEPNR